MDKNHTSYENREQNILSLEIIGSIFGGIIIMGCIGFFLMRWYNNWKFMRQIEKTEEIHVNDLIYNDTI
jgi:hypothetical protein